MLFVGAGVSRNPPSSLPLFPGLAQEIARLASEPFDKRMPTDVFLGRLDDKEDFDARGHAKRIVGRPESNFNPTHEAIVRLAALSTPRIITTNYDDHLSSAASAAGIDLGDRFEAPALPLGGSFSGLAHIHGSVMRPASDFVLTDRDFGHAYLTEGWAAKFLQQVFTKYAVLFIGYSHDDVVMNYLAMGLPPNADRFALTSDPKAERWKRLQIQPVGYPAGRTHSEVPKALDAWTARTSMGLMDHHSKMSEIIAGGPPKSPVESDYLDSMIHTPQGVRVFVEVAKDPSWLEWIEPKDVFKSLFVAGSELTDSSRALGLWFAKTYAADVKKSDFALRTLERLGQDISEELLQVLAWTTKDLWGLDPVAARRWQALLASSLGSASNTSDAFGALLYGVGGGGLADGVVLRRQLLPRLVLRRGFSWGSEPVVRPSVELTWPFDAYLMLELWSAGTLPVDRTDLISTFEQAVLDAYDLADAYDGGEAWDEISYRREAIEGSDPDGHGEAIDFIIEALRDCVDQAPLDLKLALANRWVRSRRAILRRLALHVQVESGKSVDSRVKWLSRSGALHDYSSRHELHRLLEAILPSSQPATRALLLETTLAGLNSDADERLVVSAINLLSTYKRLAPGWSEAKSALARLRRRYPSLKPSRDPWNQDRGVTIWTPSAPASAEDWLQRVRVDGPANALDWLMDLDYSGVGPDSPDWDAALVLIRSAVAVDPTIGTPLWQALSTRAYDEKDVAIRSSILSGLASAELPTDWAAALALATETSSEEWALRPISDLLLAVSKSDSAALADLKLAKSLAAGLVDKHGASFSHSDTSDWVFLGLNHWPGLLAQFWVHEIGQRWKAEKEAWIGLDEEERSALRGLLTGTQHLVDAALPMVAAETYFLFSADENFTAQELFPLFDHDSNGDRAWQAYLHNPRVNNRMLERGFLQVVRNGLSRPGVLAATHLNTQYQQLVASICTFLDVDDATRTDVIDEIVLDGVESITAFVASLQVVLGRIEDSDRVGTMWDRWIQNACRRRLDGIPREPSPEELAAWMDVSLAVGSAIPQALALMRTRPGGFGRRFALREIGASLASKHPLEMVEHLELREASTPELDQLQLYSLRDAITALLQVIGPEPLRPLVARLVERGIPRAEDWLEV